MHLRAALGKWTAVLGGANVIEAADALRDAATATFATRASVQAILRPASIAEVQECVRIANEFRVPIYPFSTGKNWGYGSRAPVDDGVLMDLGRLNRIVDFSEDLAYVTIEPGVTQRQLFAFLRERGSRLWMDATGASPDCSIIGNTMERGFGHTPMGDHCGNACGFEVVLPTGERFETGFSRFPSSKVGALSRWGIGPSFDGLFSQSNLGIVTRMSVWLMPAPEHFQAFFFTCEDEAQLPAVIDALRPLRLDGTLRSVMHIGNDYKVLAASGLPWHECKTGNVVDRTAMNRLRRKLGVGSWTGSGGLYGTKAQVKEARRRVRRALSGKVNRLQFVDDRILRLMKRLAGPIGALTGRDLARTVRVVEPVYNLLKGTPTDATLTSAYWRKPGPPPTAPDPDRDRCGLLWCSPVVPNTGTDLAAVTTLAAEAVLAHGFEPQMSISLATERTAICVITLGYDRDTPGEDQRALACYQQLTGDLLARGYPPYRLNVASMNLISGTTADTVIRAVKDALDPNHVLAPGRYERATAARSRTEGLGVA